MNMLPFKKIFTAMALAGAVMASPVSHGAAINSLLIPGINQLEDTDADRILRYDGTGDTSDISNYNAVTTGNFQVGDVFQALLRFTEANNGTISDSLGSPYALFSYSELKIETMVCASGACNVTFSAGGILSNAGTMIEVFERTAGAATNIFASGTTPETAINYVRGLTNIAEFGLNGIDDFWSATISQSIAGLGSLVPGSSQFPSGVFGLTLLPGSSLPIAPNGIISPVDGNLHDLVGNASVLQRATGLNSGWLVSTNTSVNFNVVPEPSSLALLGIGALLLGNSSKRRHSA